MKKTIEIKIYKDVHGPLCRKSKGEICVFLEARKFGSILSCFWDAERLDLSSEESIRPFGGCPLQHGDNHAV